MNINILENLIALFDTDIIEIKQIVCELILMLPLRIKQTLLICKNKLLAKPFIRSLSILDSSFTSRSLKMLDQIIAYSTQEDLQNFLEDVKDELIEKLYEIIYEQKVVEEIKNKNIDMTEIHKKIQNDPVTTVIKLLGRLSHISRVHKIELKVG